MVWRFFPTLDKQVSFLLFSIVIVKLQNKKFSIKLLVSFKLFISKMTGKCFCESRFGQSNQCKRSSSRKRMERQVKPIDPFDERQPWAWCWISGCVLGNRSYSKCYGLERQPDFSSASMENCLEAHAERQENKC